MTCTGFHPERNLHNVHDSRMVGGTFSAAISPGSFTSGGYFRVLKYPSAFALLTSPMGPLATTIGTIVCSEYYLDSLPSSHDANPRLTNDVVPGV